MTQLLRFAVVFMLLAPGFVQAAVDLTDGTYRTQVIDMSVKVPGGALDWSRSYERNAWHFAPAWTGLKFIYDDDDGSVLRIDRAGDDYEKIAADGSLFRFDVRLTITKTADGWRWADRSGSWMDYAANGQPTSFGNLTGNTVALGYVGDNLSSVLDRNGRTILTLTWSNNRLEKIADYSGREVVYSYVDGLLSQVTDVSGFEWRYEYSNGKLNKLINPLNHATILTLTPSGRTQTIVAPDGGVTRYVFDYLSGQKQYYLRRTRENGGHQEVTEKWTDRERELVRRDVNGVTQIEVIRDGRNRIYTNSRGMRTTYRHDEFRNVTEIQYPDGTKESWKYLTTLSDATEHTDELGVRSSYAYDGNGRIIEAVRAVGTPVERRSEFTYNAYGQIQTSTFKGMTVAEDATTSYVYDDYGNQIQTTDAEGQVTTATYDVMGNMLTRTDARGKTAVMTYTAAGWLETARTPLQFLTEFEYDQTGSRIKSKGPIDGIRTSDTLYQYDEMSRRIETKDPLGGSSKQRYDVWGRLYESEDALGVIRQMGFDAFGRLTTMTDGNGNVTETNYGNQSDGLEGLVARKVYPTSAEAYEYDRRDRQVEVKEILSPTLSYTTTTTYNAVGNVISVTDAKGRTRQLVYDERRRMTKEIDPILGETLYTYDTRDNLLTVTDANGNTHRFTYDKVDRKTTEARPLGQTIRYHYDPNGNVIERTSPNGAKRLFVYDDDNRLEREEHYLPAQSEADKTITYTYDQRGLLKTYHDGLTSGEYGYDDKGQRTNDTITFGTGATAVTKTLARSYAANGLPQSLTYPGATGTAHFSYDTNNQLKTYIVPGLTPGNDTLSYSYRWNAIQSVAMPGNLTRTVTLDPLRRPERILVQGSGNNGQPVMDHRYEYDEVSNITQMTTLDGPYIYDYDELDRLTRATPPLPLLRTPENPNGLPDEAYTYDNVQNRLTSAHQPGSWVYNDNNELKEWGMGGQLKVIDYDDNGSTISEQTGSPATTARTYVYDAQDRIVEVGENALTTVRYAYDPMGRRVWRQTTGAEPSTVWFLYSAEGLIGEYAENGTMVREYGWQPMRSWSTEPVWQRDDVGIHLAQNDHLATTIALTSAADGSANWSAVRESFGGTSVDAGVKTEHLLRFPGQWADAAVGLHYNYFRNYEPRTGRYLESDPTGLRGGLSLYGYVYGAPLTYADPLGLEGSPMFDSELNGEQSWTRSNNCYSYALDRSGDLDSLIWGAGGTQPGGPSGDEYNWVTCDDLRAAAKRDGAVEPTSTGDCGGTCPDGYWKIRLVITDNWTKNDYHWFRQDADGSWSSKQGGGAARQHGNTCPTVPWDDYTLDCGALCVK